MMFIPIPVMSGYLWDIIDTSVWVFSLMLCSQEYLPQTVYYALHRLSVHAWLSYVARFSSVSLLNEVVDTLMVHFN